jgi:deoxyribonucleoside regulator
VEDLRNEIKIAYSYYLYGLTQMQIAKKFNISRQKVIRELKRARQDNIVKIELARYDYENFDLEKRIEDAFGLIDSIVIPSNDLISSEGNLSRALARYLNSRMDTCSVLGIGGGPILERTTPLLSQKYSRVSVVQLMGSLLAKDSTETDMKYIYDSDQLVIAYSHKLGATPHFLHVPLFAENEEQKNALLEEPYIKNSFEMVDKCTLAVIQIFDEDTNSQFLKEYDRGLYEETKSAAGNILFNYYDENGKFLDLPGVRERLFAPTMEQLKRIPLRIGVGGSAWHIEALLGAFRTNLFQILILEDKTALALLDRIGKKR